MSLIEQALYKKKEQADATASAERRAVPAERARESNAPPAGRTADQPSLQITESRLAELGLRADRDQLRQQRAEYRHLKRSVLASVAENEANRLVLVASALEGEGKTFTATNLALSLALDPDHAVLLVDADVIQPTLSGMFGLSDRAGIMDAVLDPTLDVESLVLTTSIEGLSILPAGRAHENATEYFASVRMREVVERISSVPNRIIVMDSLPLLLSTESTALAPSAGQVLLVVRAEGTPKPAVRQAIALLGSHPNIKLVLNAVVWTRLLDYMVYGYGYGYGYGHGYGYGSRGRET